MSSKIVRAATQGRRTRNVNAASRGKRQNGQRALPSNLACHAQRAEPLPRNPECEVSVPWVRHVVNLAAQFAGPSMVADYAAAAIPDDDSDARRVSLYIQECALYGNASMVVECSSLNVAVGCVNYLREHCGIAAECTENGSN